MSLRAEVVRIARSFLGTRFLHRGRVPGVGLDCVGVLICAARELHIVPDDFDIPPYTMSAQGHVFLLWADRYMRRIDRDRMQAGDVVALLPGNEPQHLGILGEYPYGGLSIIHASSERGRVLETRLMFARGNRFAAAFALPGID